jgi:hypothetical protein
MFAPPAPCMSPTVGGENGWLFTTTLLVLELWWKGYCWPAALGYTASPPYAGGVNGCCW